MAKRLMFFAYGLGAYLIFLATLLYAVAFVGGFLVPSQLDGPLRTSLPAALAIDCAPFGRLYLDPARRATGDVRCGATLADDTFKASLRGGMEQFLTIGEGMR